MAGATRTFTPFLPPRCTDNASPEVYADLLSRVVGNWVDELSDEALINFARECRAQMLAPSRDPAVALAAELWYDCALLKVCEAQGIGTSISRFSRRREERSLLEQELGGVGIDLASSPGDWANG